MTLTDPVKQPAMKRLLALLTTAVLLCHGAPGQAQRMRPLLDLESARQMADTCLAMARENGFKVAVAVIDGGGDLKYFARMDDTSLITVDLSQDKGSTSARLPFATTELAEMAQAREGVELMRGVTILPGGLPIFDQNGEHLGGIGVSGGTAEQDINCAQAGLDRFATITSEEG